MTAYTRDIVSYIRRLSTHWRLYLLIQISMVAIFSLYFFVLAAPESDAHSRLAQRSWGGWDSRAETERCYRQERTATLLAFWLGAIGMDQWYARHWVLAMFKMITGGGFGLWIIVDVNLWIVGGIYGTHGCPGGSGNGWAY